MYPSSTGKPASGHRGVCDINHPVQFYTFSFCTTWDQSLRYFFFQNHRQSWTLLSRKHSVIRDEWNHRIFSKGFSKALSTCWPMDTRRRRLSRVSQASRNILGLSIESMYGEQLSQQALLQRKYQTILLLVAAPPCVALQKQFVLWKQTHFGSFLALCIQRKSQVESHSILWFILQSAS